MGRFLLNQLDRLTPPGEVHCSVVIPCRNGARTLERQLAALARQDCTRPFEVIVADNESTDGSAEIALRWNDRLPGLKVVRISPPGINVARNGGVSASTGRLIAFCDADDEAHPGWLRELCRALERGAGLVGGALDWGPLNPELPPRRRRLQTALADGLGFLPWPEGCNFAVRREVWEAIGGFDESYRGGGDEVEFAWRAQLAGYALESAPDAIINYAARGDARATFTQSTAYGRSHVKLFAEFHDKGMPGQTARQVAGRWWWLIRNAPAARRPGEKREAFLRRSGVAYGRLTASIERRVMYL